MDSSDIQINTPKQEGNHNADDRYEAGVEGQRQVVQQRVENNTVDSNASGSVDGTQQKNIDVPKNSDVLSKVKSLKKEESAELIYGVTDDSQKGLFTRINDFFIDHSKITIKDKSYFFHMLAVMVDAGVPVVQAIKSISGRTGNERFKRVLNTIAYNAEHGATFSDAMSRFEDVFDESEIGIIKAGEATGRLNQMLFKLSDRLDKRNDLNSKLWSAAFYPIAVLVVLILVAVGMLLWVFPTLLNLLQEGGISGDSLPLPTRMLIVIQDTVVNYWWAILLGLAGLYVVFLAYVSTEYGLVSWHYMKLKFPLVGDLLRKVYVLRFIDMLGLLIEAGVPVIDSLRITGNSLENRVYRLKTQEVISEVRDGGKISSSMSDSEFLFPPEIVQMVSVGESSANLGPISTKIAVQYEKEIDNSLKRFTSVFEPLMILFVGLFVALLALAIMSPIFNLGTVVSS